MKKKIGEIFTITREVPAGTGYSYYLTLLTEGLALIDSSMISEQGNRSGGKMIQTFVFMALKEGEASFQLARFRVFDPSDILYEEIEIVQTISDQTANSNFTPGGWTTFHKPDNEELEIFEEAFEGFIGVEYSPIMVKSQMVNGVNYIYIANAICVYPGATPYKAQVSIYKPIQEKATLTNIVKIDEDTLRAIM